MYENNQQSIFNHLVFDRRVAHRPFNQVSRFCQQELVLLGFAAIFSKSISRRSVDTPLLARTRLIRYCQYIQ
jgi:hypothetical protein